MFCAIAVGILTSSGGSSGNAKQTTRDVFAWPAGHWLVGIAGVVMIGVGIYQLARGLRQKFLDDSKTEQMSRTSKRWFTWFGTVGHVARAIVFALVGIFLVKAAIDYKADEAIGLGGALAKLYGQRVRAMAPGRRRSGSDRVRALLDQRSAISTDLDGSHGSLLTLS